MTSLYQALKSAARVVRALFSAIDAGLDDVYRCWQGHCLLRAGLKVLDHNLAFRPFVRPHDGGDLGMPGIGQLQLLPDRLRTERVFNPKSSLAETVREGEHVRKIVLDNEGEEDIDAGDVRRSETLILQ